jgi:hypothetical protein
MTHTALERLAVRIALAFGLLTLVGCAAHGAEVIPAAPQAQSIRQAVPPQLQNVSSREPLKLAHLSAMNQTTMRQFAASSVVCDGRTDNWATLQAIVNAAGQAGGGFVNFPAGICATSKTITIASSNVMLIGSGSGFPSSNPHSAGTSLLWIGAAGGTLLEYGSTVAPVQCGGLYGINLLSNNGSAAYGIKLNGAEGATFMNFAADMFSTAAVALGNTQFDQMHNVFANYVLTNTVNSGAGIIVGTTNQNSAYYNEFDGGVITLKNGTGIEVLQSDGNFFNNTQETMVNGGQGQGVLFGCGSISNHFVSLTPGYSNSRNAVIVSGIPHCPWPHEAWADTIQQYQAGSAAVPVVGTGTDFTCTTTSNKPCGSQS